MNNIFQYRETRDVVYDTYKRVEEMSAVLSKLGLFRGQFAGGVAITQGNRIFFQNTSGHGHWSILATEGDDYWRFHDVLTGSDLLTFYKNVTAFLFDNDDTNTRAINFSHPTASHVLSYDDFYIDLLHGGGDEGRIQIGWSDDDETYTRWYPSNSSDANHIISKALEVQQIPPTVSGLTFYTLRHRVKQVDGASNSAQFIAETGTDDNLSLIKYAASHSTYAGAAAIWNKANTSMLFANNDTEVMRLTSGGNLCLGVTSTSGRVDIATDNGSSNYTRMTMFQARVTTSDATATTLWSYTPTAGRTVMLEARVVARRTAGGGGAAGDGAGYVVRAAYGITTGPTTTLFGTVDQWAREAVAGYDATFVIDGSNNIVLQVTGVAGTYISWQANIYLDIIGG